MEYSGVVGALSRGVIGIRFKKFFILVILLVIYIGMWHTFLPSYLAKPTQTETIPRTLTTQGEKISIAESVLIKVSHTYFGFISLPVYFNSVGNIGYLHDWFFRIVIILFVISIILEIRVYGRRKLYGDKVENFM